MTEKKAMFSRSFLVGLALAVSLIVTWMIGLVAALSSMGPTERTFKMYPPSAPVGTVLSAEEVNAMHERAQMLRKSSEALPQEQLRSPLPHLLGAWPGFLVVAAFVAALMVLFGRSRYLLGFVSGVVALIVVAIVFT
jgi:hypothetical protein